MFRLNDVVSCELQDVCGGGTEELIVLHDQNLLQSDVFKLGGWMDLNTGLNLRRSAVVTFLATKRDLIVVLVG